MWKIAGINTFHNPITTPETINKIAMGAININPLLLFIFFFFYFVNLILLYKNASLVKILILSID